MGVLPLIFFKKEVPEKLIKYLVSFSVGSFFGGAFFHIIPEASSESGFNVQTSAYILIGVFSSYILEEFLMWRHSHVQTTSQHPHSLGYMNLFGDAVHNVIDGLMIGGSYLVSIPMGVTTSLAVSLHELPQEIGDFAVLIYSGFTLRTAIKYNFITSLTAYLGVLLAFLLGSYQDTFASFLLPFTAGNFIYIAGSDLIPELHGESVFRHSIMKLIMMSAGVLFLFLLKKIG